MFTVSMSLLPQDFLNLARALLEFDPITQDPSHACVRTDRPVKQTNKQTNKQKHKQTNKQTNKQTPQQTNKQTLKQATPPSYTANNNKYSEFGNLNLHKTQGNSYHLIQTDDETLITAF